VSSLWGPGQYAGKQLHAQAQTTTAHYGHYPEAEESESQEYSMGETEAKAPDTHRSYQ